MKILVLLGGVADIRFPLHPLSLSAEGLIEEGGTARRLLGPFDEAALELALKLRDKRPETQLEVLLLGGANSENLLRAVAAYRPDRLQRLDLVPACPWDAQLSAQQIADCVTGEGPVAELVLIGREFGDLDEGSIPVLLARRLGRPLFSLAQHVEWRDDKVHLMRERGTCEQGLDVEQPLLASVTNDKRNKLRHPLMKNVMEAKRMSFSSVQAPGQGAGVLPLQGLSAPRVAERSGSCTMLEGDTRLQARALLAYLKDQGVNS